MSGKNSQAVKKAGKRELIPAPINGLDQTAAMADLKTIIGRVISNVSENAKNGNLNLALDMITRLNDFGKVSGIGQAAGLWAIKKNAKIEGDGTQDELFAELIFARLGYAPDTIRRYVLAWDFMESNRKRLDAKVWERFLNRNIVDLIALGQATAEHGPFTVPQLKKLSLTTDLSTLRETVRKVTGAEQKANPRQLRLHPDGTLEVWQAGQVQVLGVLLQPDPAGGLGTKARAEIIRRCHIVEVA